MEIGNDDFDDFEGLEQEDTNPEELGSQQEPIKDEDYISSFLKTRGIEDKSKIKFENEEGIVEEVNWDNLSNEDKLNILQSSSEVKTDLDDSEIQLINAIRDSGLSPSEYLQNIEQNSVNRYVQNRQADEQQYSVDQYNDDDLFKADFISRMGDVTEEEAEEALERAKSNEALFKKLIEAIRNEYRTIEQENLQQAQLEQEQQAQAQYEQFAQSVASQIENFKEFSGYDLNLENDDMQMLYDFITGVDAAGNNYFAKALSDPEILVQTAWFALNGKQMVNDITEYFQKEITKVRKESYQKGLNDAKKDSTLLYKEKGKSSNTFNDLDDF